MAAPPIDLLKCSAGELSSYLLEHRFENNGIETTTFLLEATQSLPNADAIAQQIQEQADSNNNDNDALVVSQSEESQADTADLGPALHEEDWEVSLTNPRGKFRFRFCEGGIRASTIKTPTPLILPAGCARNIVVFPKPSDCQGKTRKADAPDPSPMMLICFQDDNLPTFKGKPLAQICLTVPSQLEGEQSHDKDVVETWISRVCESLSLNPQTQVYKIANPSLNNHSSCNNWRFQSHKDPHQSTTLDGMPYVKCYHGVQDGALFPMQEGLLFFKPPLFVPRSRMASIACGRGTGSSSRYVDMTLTTQEDDASLEFTNIERGELSVLNQYIHEVLIPAMQKDAAEGDEDEEDDSSDDDDDAMVVAAAAVEADNPEEEVVVAAAVDSEEDDDSDEAPVVQVETETKGRTSKRKAAREANQQTKQHYLQKNDEEDEDDDDSDDYGEGDEDEDSDEGGDDESEDESKEDQENEETDDEEDEESAGPPKKKRKGH